MATEKLSKLDSDAARAVQTLIDNGKWCHNEYLANHIAQLGVDALRRQQEDEAANDNEPSLSASRVEAGDDIDPEGWSTDVQYAWRLVLNGGVVPAVVYFTTEPDYSTVKAFARAAGMPVNLAKVEQRADA